MLRKNIVALFLAFALAFMPVCSVDGAAKKKAVKPKPKAKPKTVAVVKKPIVVPAPTIKTKKFQYLDFGSDEANTYVDTPYNADDILSYEKRRIVTIKTNLQLGSGFILKDYGRVITNYHVIDGAQWINVITSDGINHTALLVQGDKTIDVAVLVFHDLAENYLPFCFYKKSSEVKVGQKVFAIGSPQGLDYTVTTGEVNAVRFMYGRNMIQHTAKIWGGNSGGPLFNEYGDVIGINSYSSKENPDISFSIGMEYVTE